MAEIDEATAVLRDLGHARLRCGRRDEPNELERPLTEPRFARRIGADREIGDEDTMHPVLVCADEHVGACGDQRIEIREEYDRHGELGLRDEFERAVERHPLLECLLRTPLDHRTVGDGIGERHTDFKDIGAGVGEPLQERDRALAIGMAGGGITYERAAVGRAHGSKSLSEHSAR
jgi:hypothetical protein